MEEERVKAFKPDQQVYLKSRSALTTYALTQVPEKVANNIGRARSVIEENAHTLLMNREARVGPMYEESGTGAKEYALGADPRRTHLRSRTPPR